MTKKKFLILPLFLLTSTLIIFQNCGTKSNTGSFSQLAMNGDFDAEDAIVINVDKGKTVKFNIPSEKLTVLEGKRGFKCEWHFKDAGGEVIALDNKGYIYSIPDIQNSEAGRYRLTCSNGKTKIVVIYAVIVRDPSQSSVKADLTIKIVSEGKTENQTHAGLTSAQAIAKCKEQADKKSALAAVKCTWNGSTIYNRDENKNGDYTFSSIIKGKTENVKVLALTEDDSKKRCTADIAGLLKKDTNAGYKCLWRSKVLQQRAEITPLGILLGYRVLNKKESTRIFNNTSITEANAIAACKNYGQTNPSHGVVCYWNGTAVYRQAEPEIKARFDGYFFIDFFQKEKFVSLANVTEAQARQECTKVADANKGKSIRCEWNGATILVQYSGTKGTFIGKYRDYILLIIPQEKVFQNPINVTQNEAYDLCMSYKRQSGKPVKCLWNNRSFHSDY